MRYMYKYFEVPGLDWLVGREVFLNVLDMRLGYVACKVRR